jgi:hypothetical protein
LNLEPKAGTVPTTHSINNQYQRHTFVVSQLDSGAWVGMLVGVEGAKYALNAGSKYENDDLIGAVGPHFPKSSLTCVQCDQAAPECNECVSSGRKCDGPLRGTLFLDMSEKVRHVVDSQNTKKSKRRKPPMVLYGTVDSKASTPTPEPVPIEPLICSPQANKLPTTYQPLKGDIFQQSYIAHFISSHEACVHSWIGQLPNLISDPIYSPEVYAIRATTMAFYGKISGSKDLELEATRWYSKGLESQRVHLEAASNKKKHGLCTKRAVCAAILFSHFESIICTDPVGWIHHYNAASKLLELSGPKKCRGGLLHMFFRTMRLASVGTCSIVRPQVYQHA